MKVDYEKQNKEYQEYQSKMNNYNLMEKEVEAKISRKEKLNQKLSSLSVNARPRDYTEEVVGIEKRIQGLGKELAEH